MREIIEALTTELRRLKASGVRMVTVSPESIEALRKAVQARARSAGAPAVAQERKETASAPAPVTEKPAFPVARAVAEPMNRGGAAAAAAPTLPPPPVVTLPKGDKATRWASLCQTVLGDPVCRSKVRPNKKVVVGVGNLDARIFFCGEAPGAEEEIQGEPFVGPAGQLLTRMIQAMGLRREDVYIGNIMNWRPDLPTPPGGEQYGNRPPTAEELGYCLPYLKAQLEIIDPQVIVALGTTAAQGLFGVGTFATLGEIRGRWKQFAEKPVMVTYHPSYILRSPSNRSKRAIWEDLLKVMERVNLPISEKQRGYFLDK